MAERQWTDAQKNAIEAKSGTVLVSAAAGSGKTSVLTERIVRRLTDGENGVRPDSLLVVTFTNAAAAEMRSRIYSGISALMAKNPGKRSEFTSLLAVLGEMQVCTMDSFSMNLVKENCHTLGIEADFRILEEGECSALKRKTAVSVLERRFTECADTFLPLARMFESGKNDSRLISTVTDLSDFSMSEAEPEKWLGELYLRFSSCKAQDSIYGKYLAEEMLSDIDYCIYLSDAAIGEILTDAELAKNYISVYESENALLKKYRALIEKAPWDEKISLVSSLHSAVSTRQPNAPRGYTHNPVKCSAHAKRDAYKDVIEKICGYISITEEENASDTAILSETVKELSLTVLEYNERLLETKKEMSAYDFPDIAHFALKLLYDSSSPDGKTPLARELTEKYSEILIDEYQDTNRAQDTLFRSVSRDGKNMFFVGDVKQSIYRFRLASPEIFIEKCNEFPRYDGNAEKSKIILGHNFRSRKGILDFVNFMFSRLMTPECGEIEYNDDERLNFPEKADYVPSADVEAVLLQAGEDGQACTEAKYIARRIKEYLDAGVTVSDGRGERKAEPTDFCILMRSPSDIAQVYIRELEKRGISVSSDVGQSFFETPEIKTVMSYLRVLDNPARDVDMLAVMLSPLFGFTPDDTAELRLAFPDALSLYGAVLSAAGAGDARCMKLRDSISYFSRIAACFPVGELLREIYDSTAFLFAAKAMKDGENRRKNLLKLLSKAEGVSENYASLGGFVRYMELLRENGKDTGGASGGNGVRIMSMHKSKGLEFPFVFIAGTFKKFNKTDINADLVINHNAGLGLKIPEPENIKKYESLSSLAVKKINNNESLSEELRVCYVALTRAKQRLFLVTALKNRDKTIADIRNLLSGTDKPHPYFVKHSIDASRWIISTLMLHPDGRLLRNSVYESKREKEEVHIILPEEDDCPEEAQELKQSVPSDEALTEEIKRRASFRYKWQEVARCRSKHTASSLDGEHFDSVNFGKSVPAFMFAETASPSDIGTATHRFLQFCDFGKCRESVEAELIRLTESGRLTEKQRELVDKSSIDFFVNSDILRRAESSRAVFREKQFTMAKSVCELDSSIPDEFRNEKTVIIGKIDLLFLEDDGAVIVDYKTDSISDISVLGERYISQMRLYSEALKKSMGVNVKECILYSLRLKESLSLKF
ncbi:MAG: helicase-exonuclease AddAB subunit AddA [Clostridia bacterium]|nr:helicase-exonuclease AddAB subunit AddA [Clostridia bacterium]